MAKTGKEDTETVPSGQAASTATCREESGAEARVNTGRAWG